MVTSVGSVSLDVTLNTAGIGRSIAALRASAGGTVAVGIDAAQARRTLRDLEAEISRARAELNNLANERQLDQLAREFADASGGANQLGGSVAASVVAFQTLADVSKKVFSSVKDFAQQGIKSYTQFEGSLNAFKAFGGATAEESAALATEAKRVGAETSKTASSAAAAAVELAKLGFSAKDTVKELGGLVALSEASGASVETSAQIIGAASNVYGRSASDIANITAQLANLTAADAPDFLQAISKAGAVAKSNNQDLETLAATFGILRQSGFGAESAATAVKIAIGRLGTPTKQGADAIKELGISVRGPTGEMRNLMALVPEFRAAFDKLSASGPAGVQRKAELVKTLFGDEGGPAFLSLMGTSDETINRVFSGIKNSSGAAKSTSEQLITGLSGATEQLGGTIETIQLTVGEQLAPAMTVATTTANTLLGSFLKFPAPLQQIVLLTGGLVTAFAGAVVGYTVLNQLQIIQTAQTAASAAATLAKTAITTADAVATGLLNQQLSVASIRTGITTVATALYAAATGTAATAVGTLALTVGGLALKLGVVGLAFFAVSEAVNAVRGSFGSELSASLDKATNDIVKFREEVGKAPEAAKKGLEPPKFDFAKTASQSGITEAVRGQLSELGKSFGVGEGATSDYGAQLGGLTLNQKQAQLAMESLDKTLNITSQGWNEGAELLKKYGLSTDANAQKVKLGSFELAKFKDEASKQVKVLDQSITSLKGVKGATESQQALINNQITLLQNQKDKIESRVAAQDKAVEADRKSAVAQGQLAPKLDDVTEALKRQSSALDLKNAKQQADIDKRQATGQITEEEAGKQKLDLEKNSAKGQLDAAAKAVADLKKSKSQLLKDAVQPIDDQIKVKETENAQLRTKDNPQAQKNLKDIAELKKAREAAAKAATSDESVTKIDAEIQKQEMASAKASSEVSQKQIAEQKQQREKALKDEEESLNNSVANSKIAESKKLTDLKQKLAVGKLTKEQYAEQSAELKTQELNAELSLEDTKIQKYREMAAKGIITQEQLAKYEIQSAQKVSDLKGQIADADMAKVESQKQKQLEAFEEEFNKKSRAIQSDSAKKTIDAKKAQLGGTSDEETQTKTDKIQQEQAQKEIGLLEAKLAKTQQLKNTGVITAKEAADREAQIQQELTQKNLSLIEQELQAKRRAATIAIEENLSRQKLPLEKQAATLGDKSQNLDLAGKQLTAQQGLSQALAALDQQRLGYQLQRAELLNDETGKEKLKDQIYQKQYATLLQNQAAQKASTGIARQQQQIELQRQQIMAKIAVLEAEAALAKARATGASGREIAALSQALDLRRQAVVQLGKVGQAQAQINAIEDKKATVEQRTAREQLQQAQAIEKLKQAQQKKLEAVELANKATERAIKLEAIAQTIAVRRAEMGGLSSAEAAKKIEQIGLQQQQKEINLLQQKLAQTKQLRAAGVISAKEAAEREAQINQELAAGNLSLIEKQLEAKRKAAVEAIENALREKKSPLEQRGNDLDISAQRAKGIADLANAQNSYGQTVATLEQERLQTQLKQAELSGNAVSAEQIKDQILKSQFAEMDRQLASKKQMLELEIQQRGIEAERQKINAEIALLEAKAAVEKAKATGATAEIKALQSVAGLREKQIALAAESEGRNKTIDDIRRKQLSVEGDINKEKQAQGAIDREQQKKQAANKSSGDSDRGSTSGGSFGGGKTWMDGAKTWMDGSNEIVPSNLSFPGNKAVDNDNIADAETVKDMTVNAQKVVIQSQSQGISEEKSNSVVKPDSDKSAEPPNTAAEAQRKLDQAKAALQQGIAAFNQKAQAEVAASGQTAEEAAAGGRAAAAAARANADQIKADLASGKLKTTYGKTSDTPIEDNGYPDIAKLQEEFKKAQSEAKALGVDVDKKVDKPNNNLAEIVGKIYELLARQFGITQPQGQTAPKSAPLNINQEQAKARVAQAQAALDNYREKFNQEAQAANERDAKAYAAKRGINFNTEEGKNKAYVGSAEEAAAGGRASAVAARANAQSIQDDIASGKLKGGDPNFVPQVPQSELQRLQANLDAAKAAIQKSNSPIASTPQPQDAKQTLTEIGKNQLAELMAIRKILADSKCGNTTNLTVVSSSPSGEAAKLLTELSKGGY